MANGVVSENLENGLSGNIRKPVNLGDISEPQDIDTKPQNEKTNNELPQESPKLEMNGHISNGSASEATSAEAMTGVAVAEEPITDSAKVVESIPETNNGDLETPAAPENGAIEPQLEPADVTMEHTVSVEAPTSDVREAHTPAHNPATLGAEPQEVNNASAKPSIESNDAKNTGGQEDMQLGSLKARESSEPAPTKHESDGDSAEQPPSKRARIDDGSGTPSPAVKFVDVDPERKMTPNRQKYCLVVLRQLKRSKDSSPFLQPVDPVKLKIPDYFKIVTEPQDLGTIEAKLKKGEFNTIDELIDSVQLVWSNCQKYNGAESAINLMALRLKEQFERQIRSMPPAEEIASPAGRGPKSKKTGKVTATAASARPRKNTSPVAPGGVPAIRRESMGVDGRPKREIHAPPPKSLPYQVAPQKRGKNVAQLKFCGQVLKELTHKKHEQFAFPFYQPVDAKALGLHDYHTIIRNPMDLATMQQKLNAGEYESADDFEYDMRLMFRNCYKYNGPGTPVNAMGKRLENVFNEKWAEKPISRPGAYGSDSDDDSDVDDKSKQTVQMLTKQLEAMQNQIASINSQKKKKKPKKERFDDDDDGGMGPRDRDYKVSNKKGRKPKETYEDADESPMFPSFDQKTALSTKMGYMTEHQMPVVIQILKRTDPNFDPEDEEVELDVDKVHPKTIRLLWNWIMEDIQPSFLRKKAIKSKKNRNVLSETEQQRQIEVLEAQLHKFEGGDAYGHVSRYGNIPNDDSSDSDSDASSEEDD
ncbi:putative Transcription regulator BDF1 [Taphrina deformans PYCC 5710]|uniref:Transcription regulator BDF1 n=1 Tax=Taphrina deformans (strain PYCC 5710 / ATCC 11124 / CBS 356.35 / IMI 108563 / JCM 9778 / NBRC 8474) TaxID=1097556 RepID=R4XBC8_TAPDE|nr:putative Transcription regulator BDF1 [Taphrina deformans PYCC 5710]|eukprot:CCG80638.1 putative Transcription regulator BDF1 [Taphrina deformans PYCC 5710]